MKNDLPIPKPTAANAWITKFGLPLTASNSAGSDGQALNGLSFATKDNIDVAGIPTTAACPDFAFTPASHATVIARLLGAGAVLHGKTNLDQFACGLNGTRSPFGPVPNAFNPDYVSGGSSSGSAYVVASGQVNFSLGTDTAGSGRVPAGLNNIVGLKPSKGLISTHGVLPAARSVDCVSIFARDVLTAWRAFEAARGHDPQDPYSRKLTLKRTRFPGAFRVGVPKQLEWYGDALSPVEFHKALELIQTMGGQVVEIDYAPLLRAATLLYESALISERLEALAEFFTDSPDSVIDPVYRLLSPGAKYSAVDVFRAMTELKALSQQADQIWADIDVLMVPTAPTHVKIDAMLADPIELNRRLGHYTNFVNLLDYAAIAVPSSIRSDGLPFGVTFIAPAGSDWQLAELGLRYHQKTGLTLGATPERVNQADVLPLPHDERRVVSVAVVGAHLSGMPLNWQLQERGAELVQATTTSDAYRFYALANTTPPKPGLVRVKKGDGASIAIEIWQIPEEAYGSFVALIPSPLGIGQLETANGSMVQGFLCEQEGLHGATDITHFKSWRSYIASLRT